jgi:hypothetical protein
LTMPQQPNGIGQFEIGISPIGDQPFDWTQTLYSEYANSPVVTQWLDFFSQWIDANESVDMFYDDLWNIDTAQGYGLDVLGRIVRVDRVIQIVPTQYLWFEEADETTYGNTFGNSIWYGGEPIGTSSYALSDDAFRQLILAKAAANIWDGSIPGLNRVLTQLFPGQVCYCTDGGNLTMTYTFTFPLNPVQQSIVTTTGVLPRPAGVAVTIVQP